MFGFTTKTSSFVLALCFFLNTGVLIFGVQVFAWLKMSSNAPEDTSFTVALQVAVSGQNPCEICEFVSEHNPVERDDHSILVKIEFPTLYLDYPIHPWINSKNKKSYCADQGGPFLSVFWGMDPPPPKVC